MIKILVLLIAVLLIAAIIWWFFGRHQEKAVAADVSADSQDQKVKVEVNGGYSPSTIVLKKAYRQNWILSQGSFILLGTGRLSRYGNQRKTATKSAAPD